MTWGFQAQLKVGQRGEELLRHKWAHRPVERHVDMRGPDFVDSRGRIIELKTDTYKVTDTFNFFMERLSNKEKQSPGGPWQALSKGADVFVYLYINSGVWFVFEDIPALVKRLDGIILLKKSTNVPNRGYVTQGYKIPRTHLQDLYREEVL